jgi:predicted nucleic acid-binding protein
MSRGGLTLDTGAIIAAEKSGRRFWTIGKEARDRKAIMTVPVVVLAQAWRGNNALVALALKGCRIEEHEESIARRVGELLAKSRTSDVVDAIVVLGAIARGDTIVTSDVKDIEHLIAAAGARGVGILHI